MVIVLTLFQPHTGIFPFPYQYTDREDCALGKSFLILNLSSIQVLQHQAESINGDAYCSLTLFLILRTGPDGELRKYMERLVDAENVQKFVEENPIGQSAITETHESWSFYSRVIKAHKN